MQIDRLRLVGFKSFADAAEVAIGPGLTGIIGPNGCGKSNLAEALRWVMGENSARRLRGGAMDDVIFGGTAGRAARNLAEVALTIDNSARDAPFAFNDREDIEIVRRIERGGGSSWRDQRPRGAGARRATAVRRCRERRAFGRDRQSGAGRRADRGQAGRTPAPARGGRRHRRGSCAPPRDRAETRRRRGESDAARRRHRDDGRRSSTALQKQARQAQRYRRLGEQIRQHEALLFHARWLAAEGEAESRAAELSAAERNVAEAAERAVAERQAREKPKRRCRRCVAPGAEAKAELQRLTQRRDALEHELAQVVAARREAERRLAELLADLGREDANLIDAEAALARLGEERRAFAAAEAEASRRS